MLNLSEFDLVQSKGFSISLSFSKSTRNIGLINRFEVLRHQDTTSKPNTKSSPLALCFLGTCVTRTITNSIIWYTLYPSAAIHLLSLTFSKHNSVMCRKEKSKCTSITSDVKKRRRSLKKAPGAPKRFKSSYIHFFTSVRGEIAKELDSSAGVSVKNLNDVMSMF